MTIRLTAAMFCVSVLLMAQTKLLPVDESASDPQFAAFYKAFRTAVAQKNAKALLDTLDPEVQSEIDGDKGSKAFDKHWNPSNPASKVWSELAVVIALGGSFSTEQGTKMFCAPYIYSKFPDAVDSFGHGVILGAGVPLRSRPDDGAPVKGKLSYDIVKVPDWGVNLPWIRVVTGTGTGYVRRTEIRSPSDFRVCFHRKNGRWMLRWLVAGD
ncbi:MAG: hypothetical protein ABJF23_08305 [Bryobacteraceae bacterium]